MTLQDEIQRIAFEFASQVVRRLRAASLDELMAPTAIAQRTALPLAGDAPMVQMRGPGPRKVARKARVHRSKRRMRRSTEEIAELANRIVLVVEQHGAGGLRAEEIRSKLPGSVDAAELAMPIALALKARHLRKSGEKRATTYFPVASGPKRAKKGQSRKKASRTKAKVSSPVSENANGIVHEPPVEVSSSPDLIGDVSFGD